MATIEDFIHHRLSTDADIAAVVGSRVYRVKMPDNPTLPALTFQTLTGTADETTDGPSGLLMPVIGIDCWATTAGAAQALAVLVKAALHPFRGEYSGVTIHSVQEWSYVDLYDPDTEIYHVATSCRVWYS